MGLWDWVKIGFVATAAAAGAAAAVALAPVAFGAGVAGALGAAAGSVISTLALPKYTTEEEDKKSRDEQIRKEKEVLEEKSRDEQIRKEKEVLEEKSRDEYIGILESINEKIDTLEVIIKKAEKNNIPENQQKEVYQKFCETLKEVRVSLCAFAEADIPDKEWCRNTLNLLSERANSVSEKFRASTAHELRNTVENLLEKYSEANQTLDAENRELKGDLPPELKLRVGLAENRIPEECKEEVAGFQVLIDKIANLHSGVQDSLSKGELSLNKGDEISSYQHSKDMFDKRREINRLVQNELLPYLNSRKVPLFPSFINSIVSSLASYELDKTVEDFYRRCIENHAKSIKAQKHGELNNKIALFLQDLEQHRKDYNTAIANKKYAEADDIILKASDLATMVRRLLRGQELKGGSRFGLGISKTVGRIAHSVSHKLATELDGVAEWLSSRLDSAMAGRESRFTARTAVSEAVMLNTVDAIHQVQQAVKSIKNLKEQEAKDAREREAEVQRQKELEAQKRREAEVQRQKELEAQKRSKAEAQRQKEPEAQKRREVERLKAESRLIEAVRKKAEKAEREKAEWAESVKLAREEDERLKAEANEKEAYAKDVVVKPEQPEENLGLDLPSVPTHPVTGVVAPSMNELGENEYNINGRQDLHHNETDQNLSTSELYRERKGSDTQGSVADEETHSLAEATGVSESAFFRIQEDEDAKKAKSALKSKKIEKELVQRAEAIEKSLRESREAFKVWAGLSDEKIKEEFGAFAYLFFQVYPDSSIARTCSESAKEMEEALNGDPGYYRIYAFLQAWRDLGLHFISKDVQREDDYYGRNKVLSSLDALYNKIVDTLRSLKKHTDFLLKKAEESDDIKSDKSLDKEAKAQNSKAIALNNFIREVQWLSTKLNPYDSCIPLLKKRSTLIRSELSKINHNVKLYDNILRSRLGTSYPGDPFFVVKSYEEIEGSERLLEAGFYFDNLIAEPPKKQLSKEELEKEQEEREELRRAYQSGKKIDPRFTQLYEIFISSFRESIASELKKIEQDEKGERKEEWPLIVDIETIVAVNRDVMRLSPISNVGKVLEKLEKEDAVSSLILDYDEKDDVGLSSDLIRRFRSLIQWKGWIKVKPTKFFPSSPKITSVSSQLEENRRKGRLDNDIKNFRNQYISSVAFSRARKYSYQESEVLREEDSSLTRGFKRMVCIPRIDTGEAFGGLSSKKRRIFKVSLRVINTADIEVGVKGQHFSIVEDLRGFPKTGEFDVFLSAEAGIESELVIRQTKPSPFCLTSVTAHLVAED